MTDEARKKLYKRAAQVGLVLAFVCHFLPPDYRVVCETVARVCSGGL